MRRAARAVVSLTAVAALLDIAPACGGSPFESDPAGAGGSSAGAAAKGGTAGASAHGGGGQGSGALAGTAGTTSPASGGTANGGAAADTGLGGEGNVGQAGAAGSGSNDCEVELLVDGAFDASSTAWAESADPLRALVLHQSADPLLDENVSPMSPEYALFLGGVNGDNSNIAQEFVVPEAALTLVVSGWVHVHTAESPDQDWDFAYLDLETEANGSSNVADFTNLDQNDDWTSFSFPVNAAPYAGATTTFRLSSVNDDNAETSFFLDSLSIVAKICDN